ncbi:MAG: cell division protein FtsZ [Candidatus Lindowbacteria bacterium]|nr:cell division protein FtsZ [Candidatus Lindowbacteria bacterium]
MAFKFEVPDEALERPGTVIKVIGVGGGGTNAVNRMIQARVRGVDFIVANTDSQSLTSSVAPVKIPIGSEVTRGLGAGANPEIGKQAAEEAREYLVEVLQDADMVFVTAGMGGGTGSGASPIVASVARELGALTVGVVTKPFHFEGRHKMKMAEEAIAELRENVDTLIVVPNEKLLAVSERRQSALDAYRMADDVLRKGVQGISDIILIGGTINVDFNDVRTIMQERGDALMGMGSGSGEKRAIDAATQAIQTPLIDDLSLSGATGLLVNITGGIDLGLQEVSEAMEIVTEACDHDCNIIHGICVDESLEDECRIIVIATGFNKAGAEASTTVAFPDSARTRSIAGPSQPAFARRKQTVFGESHGSMIEEVAGKHAAVSDDLDTPTFVRWGGGEAH